MSSGLSQAGYSKYIQSPLQSISPFLVIQHYYPIAKHKLWHCPHLSHAMMRPLATTKPLYKTYSLVLETMILLGADSSLLSKAPQLHSFTDFCFPFLRQENGYLTQI